MTRGDIRALVDGWKRSGASGSAIRNRLVPLRVLVRRAMDEELLTQSPFEAGRLGLPSVPSARRRAVSPTEARSLLAALPADVRAIYATAIYAGLRRGELIALRWQDVSLPTGRITVSSSWDERQGRVAPKSRAGSRTVPLVAALIDALAVWRSVQLSKGLAWVESSAHVFPGRAPTAPFTPSNVRRKANAAWQAAGLVPLKLHEGRHSAASAMIAAGGSVKDVQVAIGHSDASTTLDVYGHLLGDAVEVMRRRLDRYHEAE